MYSKLLFQMLCQIKNREHFTVAIHLSYELCVEFYDNGELPTCLLQVSVYSQGQMFAVSNAY